MTELPHGYTPVDLTRIARRAVRTQAGLILEQGEAWDVAEVAIAERLCTGPAPTLTELFQAARDALAAANRREISYSGLDYNSARSGREGPPPGFARYWHGRSALVSPWEEAVTERLAVRQVWAALPPRHRETLAALAEQGSYEAARETLGWTVGHWNHRLRMARIEARRLWYAPEEAAPQWGQDRPGRGPDAKGRSRGLLNVAHRRRLASR